MNDEPSQSNEPTQPDPQDPVAQEHKKTKLWMVATGVLAIAVIGLLIWGRSTKSDLDKANDAAAGQQKQAGQVEAGDSASLAAAKRRHAQLVRGLQAEQLKASDISAEADRDKGQIEEADNATKQANGNAEKADAELQSAQATQKAAATCAKGSLVALGQLLNASNSQEGSQKASETLDATQSACDAASAPN